MEMRAPLFLAEAVGWNSTRPEWLEAREARFVDYWLTQVKEEAVLTLPVPLYRAHLG